MRPSVAICAQCSGRGSGLMRGWAFCRHVCAVVAALPRCCVAGLFAATRALLQRHFATPDSLALGAVAVVSWLRCCVNNVTSPVVNLVWC